MKKTFKIGSFIFQLIYSEQFIIPTNFLKFEIDTANVEYTYEISIHEQLPQLEGKIIARRLDLLVFEQNGLESRYIGVKGQSEYYASYREIDEKYAQIVLVESKICDLNIDPVFTSLLALERRMIERNCLTLHCAYLNYQGSAILFSAPSGTGKSTQANLWEQYENGKTINGDRGLLQKIDDDWFVGGWPVCGTSEICNNITMPIRAIVMLSKSKDNEISQLKGMKAVQSLYSQVTINYWNKNSVNYSLDLIEELISKIPVYHLACDISQNAVNCLKNELMKK